jgi:hypothetical protein
MTERIFDPGRRGFDPPSPALYIKEVMLIMRNKQMKAALEAFE